MNDTTRKIPTSADILRESLVESRTAFSLKQPGVEPLTDAEYENRRRQLEESRAVVTDEERSAVHEQFTGEATLADLEIELADTHRSYSGTIVNLNQIIEHQADVIAHQKIIVADAKRSQIRLIFCSVVLIGISLWSLSRGD